MQLLSFLFFLSSLAIVYNCICIDVFCRFITYVNKSSNCKKKKKEHTNNILTDMVPERVRTITTATYEAVHTYQDITLSELEDVTLFQHRMLFDFQEHNTS